MSAIRQLLNRVKTEGARRSGTVTTVSMGRERTFEAFDIGDDTFVLEKGVVGHLGERPSVLLVEKRQLRRRTKGRRFRCWTDGFGNCQICLQNGAATCSLIRSCARTS